MWSFDLSRRLVAEGLGTALLLAVVVGSGIMGEQLSGGTAGIALLANSLATGAALVVLILVFGPISGAHFNPVVTLAFALRRDISRADAGAYVGVQMVGALCGVGLAHVMFDMPLYALSAHARSGPGQWTGEFVATFGLIATILLCLRFRAVAVPYAVGLFITAGYWFTSSTSFANPAVTVARALTDSFAGIHPADVPAFLVVQLAAALAAALLAAWILAPGTARTTSRATALET